MQVVSYPEGEEEITNSRGKVSVLRKDKYEQFMV